MVLQNKNVLKPSIMYYKIVADCLRSNLVHLVKTWIWRGQNFGQSVIGKCDQTYWIWNLCGCCVD